MAVVSGGTTLIDNGALDAGVPSGKLVLLSTQTASASSSIDFTSGIDSTYDSYVFKFINCHPSTDNVFLGHQADVSGGSSYAQTCTNTMFYTRHGESDSPADLDYYGSDDQAQGTDINKMAQLGSGSDECGSGYMQIFNPSSTTFVKHFISDMSGYHPSDQNMRIFNAGYYNTTSALVKFRFKMSSGNIDSGTIKMYGVG
jgi:hypothetical protein